MDSPSIRAWYLGAKKSDYPFLVTGTNNPEQEITLLEGEERTKFVTENDGKYVRRNDGGTRTCYKIDKDVAQIEDPKRFIGKFFKIDTKDEATYSTMEGCMRNLQRLLESADGVGELITLNPKFDAVVKEMQESYASGKAPTFWENTATILKYIGYMVGASLAAVIVFQFVYNMFSYGFNPIETSGRLVMQNGDVNGTEIQSAGLIERAGEFLTNVIPSVPAKPYRDALNDAAVCRADLTDREIEIEGLNIRNDYKLKEEKNKCEALQRMLDSALNDNRRLRGLLSNVYEKTNSEGWWSLRETILRVLAGFSQDNFVLDA